ncbi:MAG: glycosyltransferase family 2 protein [Armatimonadetes bacterium]|nr:glycosyltransferase family 2 protein [Armatimonadota bacterium]
MPPSVTVVIPAYNAERTVVEAIESVNAQSTKVLEVIVACDGCTDRTAALSERVGARALPLQKANGAVARNEAAKAANGELLFFLDADDWWEPTKVEAHLEVWERFDGSFVIDRSTPWNPDGSRSYWTGGLDSDGEAQWDAFLSHKAWASGSSFSVHRECYWKTGGFNEALSKFQDVDFWVRSAQRCGPAHTMSVSLTNYRLSSDASVSRSTSFIEENLSAIFAGWPFATEDQKDRFRSHAFLTAAEVTPWPESVAYFQKARWPIGRRFFWKCLRQSLLARRSP